jgi:hypothetical protein
MAKQTKPAKKNPQVHGQASTQVWVRNTKNSAQLFLLTIRAEGPAEFIFNKALLKEEPKRNATIFFMFAEPEILGSTRPQANKDVVTEHVIKHTVNWKGLNADEKIKDAKKKKDMLTNGTDFPTPWSPEFTTLVQFGKDIEQADKMLLARSKNEPYSARDLNTAVNVLYKDAKNIGSMVQLKMDTCVPVEAIRICTGAGYTYKAIVVRGPRPNRVRKMTEAGWVEVEGEGKGGRDWQFSLAPFAENPVIKDMEYTTGGITTYKVGQSRVDAWFRWRLVLTKGRRGEWSDWYKGETP